MLQARARAMDTIAIGPAMGSTIAPAYVERELKIASVSPRIDEAVHRLRGELGLPTEPSVNPASIDGERVERPQLEAAV